MKIQVSGRQVDLGDALRTHVIEKLDAAITKYFDKDKAERKVTGAQVVFAHEGPLYLCTCKIHLSVGLDMTAEATDAEIYESFNQAVERLAKQVRRDKRRRRNHHGTTHRVVAD